LLDIPEFEEFDKVIYSHSWLDESAGELMAWSRNEFDDFRRNHADLKIPTSTEVLRYFGVSLDRFGWAEVMMKRYGLFTPDRKGNELEWGRHKNNSFYGEFNSDDEVVDDPFPDNIQDMSIVGWEDRLIDEVDAERELSALSLIANHKCPGGTDCCLDNDMNHELCICDDSDCKCHSKQRYQSPAKRNPFAGISMYTPPKYFRAANS
jgi:hypothetical protein